LIAASTSTLGSCGSLSPFSVISFSVWMISASSELRDSTASRRFLSSASNLAA
jgi:hypothetical protein